VTSSDKVQPRAAGARHRRRASDRFRFGSPVSAVRIVGVGQENAGAQKGKQGGHDLGHCRIPPTLAMPTTTVFKNSR
jgi:hypothetical protein